MAVRVVKVPDIGEGIAEVEVVEWHVKVGDAVAEDQPLATVMTDKASVEIPSPAAGTVLALGGEPGQMLAVGSELARIETAVAAQAPQSPAVRPEQPVDPSTGSGLKAVETGVSKGRSPDAPLATAPPRSVRPAQGPEPVECPVSKDRPIASPAVRRRAWELGIELADVRPSGSAGRIVHADLDAHLARGGRRTPAAPAPSPAAPPAYAERDGTEAIAVIGLRRRIAMKMQEAKRRIPHFSYVEEIDATELEALRGALNAEHAGARPKLTLLAFIARALVLACAEFPQVNARFDDEAGVITRHAAVHLGVATQTANGLLVPVLRHAEARDVWGLAAEVARLADAARAGRATRDELGGSTITLTSLGAQGGIVSTPVINHPEVAIVGVNRLVERPALRGGLVVPRLAMNLSSSFDHRVVDGADAAAFIQAVRRRLEQPARLFVP